MARPSKLSSMSIEALIKLRDDIGSALSRKAGQLQSELAALGDGGWLTAGKKGGAALEGARSRAGSWPPSTVIRRTGLRRGQDGEPCRDGCTAQIKAGKKREDFAIDKSLAKTKKSFRQENSQEEQERHGSAKGRLETRACLVEF